MSNLFALLFVASLVGLGAALIKPSWLRLPSRKVAGTVFGIAAAVTLVGYSMTAPPTPPKPAQPVVTEKPTQVATTTVAAPTAPSVDTKALAKSAVGTMTATTNYFASLFSDAKQAAATQGTELMTFRNTNCIQSNAMYDKIVQAYTDVSNLYYDAHVTEPDALGTWRDDLGSAASDLCTYASDAIDARVGSVSQTKLNTDQHTFTADLATARADVQALGQ